jgi:hypothetical protein
MQEESRSQPLCCDAADLALHGETASPRAKERQQRVSVQGLLFELLHWQQKEHGRTLERLPGILIDGGPVSTHILQDVKKLALQVDRSRLSSAAAALRCYHLRQVLHVVLECCVQLLHVGLGRRVSMAHAASGAAAAASMLRTHQAAQSMLRLQ